MDWGIVASVVIANVLVILGILLIAAFMIFLVISSIKKKAKAKVLSGEGSVGEDPAGVVRSCPMTFCPMNKVVENDQTSGTTSESN